MAYDPNGGATNEALRIAADHNFFPAHTGGGCFAFERTDRDEDGTEHVWMITFSDDPCIDGDPNDPQWKVGRYLYTDKTDGSSRVFEHPMTLEQACEFSATIGDPRLASSHYKVGERVELWHDYDQYPVGIFRRGETGTVIAAEAEYLMVKMDRHFPELAEWRNELQVYVDRIDCLQPEGTLQKLGMRYTADGERKRVDVEDAVHEALHAAFNAAAAYIQGRLGVSTGDLAGQFFSGKDDPDGALARAMTALVSEYYDAEIAAKKAEG